MRKIGYIFLLVLVSVCAFAQQNRVTLKNGIQSNFPTGKQGGIQAAELRQTLTAIVDGSYNLVDDGVPVTAINVKKFGAKGNGTTDDTEAIYAAIESAPEGSTVFFPAGTYITNSTLNISKPVTLLGQDSTIKSTHYAYGTKLNITSSNVTIRGLTIDGGYASGLTNYTGPGLITISNSSNTALTDINILECTIKNASFVGIAPQDNVVRVRIKDCSFTNTWCSIYFGTTIGGSWPSNTDCEVINCRFYNNWGSGGQSGACKVQGDYTRTVGPTRFVFSGNVLDNCGEMGVELWKNGKFCTVSNNTINKAIYSVSIDGCSYTNAENNIVTNFQYCGFEVVQGSNHCIVSGNTINGYLPDSTTRSATITRGIVSSGSRTWSNKFIGNTIIGCSSEGIYTQDSDYTQIESNRIEDCDTLINLKSGSQYRIYSNTLIGPASQFIFLDYNDKGGSDVVIENNNFRGNASSDGITIYDNNHGNILSGIRISGNDTTNATYGNNVPTGVNNLMANTPNFQIFGNRYLFNGVAGTCKFVDYTNSFSASLPFDRVFQAGGISVAGKTTVAFPIAATSRWVKIWSGNWGSPIAIQLYVNATDSDYNQQNSFLASIVAAPYGQASSVMLHPQTNYNQGLIEEVIVNNVTGPALEVWLRIKATTRTGSVDCYISDNKNFIQTSPLLLTTEPTWGYVVRAFVKDFQQDTLTPPRLLATKSISSYTPSATWLGTGGRLHIRGVGTEGYPSYSRIARFDLGDGTEAFGVDPDGVTLVKKSLVVGDVATNGTIKTIASGLVTADFATIYENADSTRACYCPGARAENNPAVMVGFSTALPAGIVLQQARVTADDIVSVTLRNVTGAGIAVGSVGVRTTTIQY